MRFLGWVFFYRSYRFLNLPYQSSGVITKARFLCPIMQLYCFRVENIIITSVDEVVGMWRKGYGFSLIRDELMNKLVEHNTLTFPTAIRLQISLLASPVEAKPYYASFSLCT
ncbi:hypothetical protein ACOSQ2_027287 [Xanthoceras sorbifolium]